MPEFERALCHRMVGKRFLRPLPSGAADVTAAGRVVGQRLECRGQRIDVIGGNQHPGIVQQLRQDPAPGSDHRNAMGHGQHDRGRDQLAPAIYIPRRGDEDIKLLQQRHPL